VTTQQEALEAVDGKRRVSGGQVAIVVGALVVVLAALWFFFLKSDGSPEAAPASDSTTSAPANDKGNKKDKAGRKSEAKDKGKAKDKKKNVVKAPVTPVESFEVFAPKDPFDPLVSASTGGTDAGSDTSAGAVTSATTSADSTGGHTVRLVDIFTGAGGEERAQVQVDDTVYRVSEGKVFADSFELVSIDNGCATMLFGDDQFTICEGEELLK
jgi:hypothetical protein